MSARSDAVEYRLVLPAPWERLDLQADLTGQVRRVVGEAVARMPKGALPPDQLTPTRARMEHELETRLREAKDKGGIDYYMPTDLMHGVHIPATFVVSRLMPNALADEEVTARVLAARLAEPGTTAEQVGDSIWARSDTVLRRQPDDLVADEHQARKIEYLTPQPGDPRCWIVVTFTTLGDGTMDSEFTELTVTLFDAIMSTWRWVGAPPVEG